MKLKPTPLNNKGVAILITLFSISLMMFIAMEISRTSQIEYVVASQNLNRVRAYYASRAGAEFGLLRVLLYQKAEAQLGDKLADQPELLDLIWQLPMDWPPQVAENVSATDKEEIQGDIKESFMNGKFFISITTEDSKIDITDMVSPSKSIAEATKKQILQIFDNKMESDEQFEDAHRGENFEDIVNNMIDWMDEDTNSIRGGPESNLYEGDYGDSMPPNEPFKTIEELRMVAGVTEEFYQLLYPRITIYGATGINVNEADEKLLREIVTKLTDEQVQQLIKFRADQIEGEEGGPFKDNEAFEAYLLQELRVDAESINPQKIPLYFGKKHNFRIHSVGQFSNVTREIELVTFDFDGIAGNLVSAMQKEKEEEQGATEGDGSQEPATPPSATADPSGDEEKKKKPATPKSPPPKGKPMIIYWSET